MASILVVDDSASMRPIITFTLEVAGHKVTEATNGLQGLVTAKSTAFDLIMSNV